MKTVNKNETVKSSFRDPSGFLFFKDGSIFRQVNNEYKENYDLLMESGLYKKLLDKGLLIPHEDLTKEFSITDDAYKIIKPEMVQFISYPYEWSFSQIKDAALATLEIQKIAFESGMSLKDSSAYNIQFVNGKPVLIDTLSFEKYKDGQPWVAYKQFCQHFLAPLALMSYMDIRLNQLSKIFIDGVPVDLASSLLPKKTWLKFSLLTHIHLHAKSQQHYADKEIKATSGERKMGKIAFLGLIDSLETIVKKLKWQVGGTEWGDYYNDTNYTSDSFQEKKVLLDKFIAKVNPKAVWDLGANTGEFSRIASAKNVPVISFDIDPMAVEKNYLSVKNTDEVNIMPLLLDLTNPSSSIGWANNERLSFIKRGPVDMVFSLALIHHLAISNNIPLSRLAEFFASVCKYLVIEFVPKSDSQVKRLLASREDIFKEYDIEHFEKDFQQCFIIEERIRIKDTERTLYLMKIKEASK